VKADSEMHGTMMDLKGRNPSERWRHKSSRTVTSSKARLLKGNHTKAMTL
jgi:hypothetical protein